MFVVVGKDSPSAGDELTLAYEWGAARGIPTMVATNTDSGYLAAVTAGFPRAKVLGHTNGGGEPEGGDVALDDVRTQRRSVTKYACHPAVPHSNRHEVIG